MFGLNKVKEDKTRRYIVMGKYKSDNRFILEKQFINRHSADHYVELMKEENEANDRYEYFLFEQSKDYNIEETDEG